VREGTHGNLGDSDAEEAREGAAVGLPPLQCALRSRRRSSQAV
jgi:hypothetical protein